MALVAGCRCAFAWDDSTWPWWPDVDVPSPGMTVYGPGGRIREWCSMKYGSRPDDPILKCSSVKLLALMLELKILRAYTLWPSRPELDG